MKFHRLARYFPVLEGEDFDLLVESIRKNGQREPIVTHEGQILDGINRWRACQKLGIEPEYRELPEGTDPLQYVVDMNIRRRHMDASQRAMLATEMLPEFEAEAKNRRSESAKAQWSRSVDQDHIGAKPEKAESWKDWKPARDDAAKVFGVSGPTIQRAKRVKEEAPDKVADIVSGKTTVTAVDAELRKAKQARWEQENPIKKKPIGIAEQQYLTALRKAAYAIPPEPPEEWTEEGMREARAIVEIIRKRLGAFNE